MANTSVFIPAGVSIVTDEGLTGGGTLGSPLSVVVDDSTIVVNGSNQLESTGAAVAFKTIAVAGQSDIVADAADDTLTVVAGANITITTNAGTDTLTIAATGGGASPAGSGSELQYRSDATTFGAVTGSSTSGGAIGLTGGFLMTVPAPSIAGVDPPSLAGAGAGNVNNGVHRYKFTYTTAHGETLPSVATDPVTVVDNSTDGKVTVPVPFEIQEATYPTGVSLYRTVAGGSVYKLVAVGIDYFNDYEDDTADASLGANAPTVSTAIESGYTFSGDGVLTPPNAATAFTTNILRLSGADGSTGPIIMPAIQPDGTAVALQLWGGIDGQGPTNAYMTLGGNTATDGGAVQIVGGSGIGVGGNHGAIQLKVGVFATTRLVIDKTGRVITPPVAVGDLPVCDAGGEGARASVNDSNAVSFTAGIGAVVANGGSTHVPVYCDGTNWRIG